MRITLSAIALLCAISAPAAAYADTFDYTFTSAGPSFTYDSPTLITTSSTFTPLTCSDPDAAKACISIKIDPADGVVIANFATGPGLDEDGFIGLSASLFTVGDHTAGDVTLDIVDVPAATAVPEPSSLILLGTGLLGFAEATRRKFHAR